MNESIYNYMKLGLIHFMAYPSTIKGEGPIIETIKKIAVDDYFNAIEITWIKDQEIRKQVKKMFKKYKRTIITCSCKINKRTLLLCKIKRQNKSFTRDI